MQAACFAWLCACGTANFGSNVDQVGGTSSASAGFAGNGGNNQGGSASASGGASGTGTAGSEQVALSCPKPGTPLSVGILQPQALVETSGLAASRKNPGVIYAQTDSETEPRGYALTQTGELIATLELPGALAENWEDIAVGPGPDNEQSYIYFADIGDNKRVRTTSIALHRVAEPALDVNARNGFIVVEFVTLYMKYVDGPRDAETVFVDPKNGDIYIVTKDTLGDSMVFVARAPHDASKIVNLESVASLKFGSAELPGSPLATGGDISADGSQIVIRTYDAAYLWLRKQTDSVAQALTTPPCTLTLAHEPQGEAICFIPDGTAYLTTSEGAHSAIWRVDLTR
jgi:hypothetical protein